MSFVGIFGLINWQLQKNLERNMYTKYKDGIPGYIGYNEEQIIIL